MLKSRILVVAVSLLLSSVVWASSIMTQSELPVDVRLNNFTSHTYVIYDTSGIPFNIFPFPSTLNSNQQLTIYQDNSIPLPTNYFTIRYYDKDALYAEGSGTPQYCAFTWDPKNRYFTSVKSGYDYTDKNGNTVTVDCQGIHWQMADKVDLVLSISNY